MGVPVRLGCGLAFSVKRETTRSTISVRPKRPRTPVRMYMTRESFPPLPLALMAVAGPSSMAGSPQLSQ